MSVSDDAGAGGVAGSDRPDESRDDGELAPEGAVDDDHVVDVG